VTQLAVRHRVPEPQVVERGGVRARSEVVVVGGQEQRLGVRDRVALVKALCLVAAERGELVVMPARFDSFTNDAQPEAVTRVDRRADDRRVARVRARADHEAAVDLELAPTVTPSV